MAEQRNHPMLDYRRFERSVSPSPQVDAKQDSGNEETSFQNRSDDLAGSPPAAVSRESSPEDNGNDRDEFDSHRAVSPKEWHSDRGESEDELEQGANNEEDNIHHAILSPREKKKLKADEDRDEDYDEGSAEESEDEDECEDWGKEEVVARKGTRTGLRSSDRN